MILLFFSTRRQILRVERFRLADIHAAALETAECFRNDYGKAGETLHW